LASVLADPRSAAVAGRALAYLEDLFARPDSLGSMMAGRAEQGAGDLELVAASVSALVENLLTDVEAADAGHPGA